MKAFFKTILYTPLYNLLIFLVWLVPNDSIGWAVIILTILVRAALLPASIKAAKAQARLQLLQPEMNKIKLEIKDQQAQGKALMELYKKEGVSPFGSCLPMLIQLPIIFILYRVFSVGIDESRFSLLYSFVPHPDKINTMFYGIDLAKPELWLLPILAGATQFVLSKMMAPPTPQAAPAPKKEGDLPFDPTVMMNKQMIYIFPLVTIFIARSLPAALGLYWITTTIFGIAQQWYVNKSVRNNPREVKEAREDLIEIEKEYAEPKAIAAPEKKKDRTTEMMTKMMKRKLDKEEKKKGIEVTIRKKK